MTKAAAIYNFWAGFGLPAFEENSVPSGVDEPAFPYITYQLITDSFGDGAAMTASLWYRDSSWVKANAKADEISEAIGYGGDVISCDGGSIWIKRGQPFAQRMGDASDQMIKRIIINIEAEYFSRD